MTASVSQEVRGKIKQLCSYIRDDSMIAAYMAVPKALVQTVRKALPAHKDVLSGHKGGRKIDPAETDNTRPQYDALRNHQRNALKGSERLAARIETLIYETSLRLDIPPEYRRDKVLRRKFTMAYLGFEVRQ